MKIKGSHDYWVLLCDDNHYSPKEKWRPPMICGVFASKKEAEDCAKDVKGCLLKHYIKRCSVTVEYGTKKAKQCGTNKRNA